MDTSGPPPRAGQFYMLAADGWGGPNGRPYLPRAFAVAEAEAGPEGVRLDFLLEAVGPGTERLEALALGVGLHVTGPLGRPFSSPGRPSRPRPRARSWSAAGSGSQRWRFCSELSERGIPQRVLLGFRDRAHAGGLDLFRCSEVRTASEDGHTGHQGYVTDLLAVLLEG